MIWAPTVSSPLRETFSTGLTSITCVSRPRKLTVRYASRYCSLAFFLMILYDLAMKPDLSIPLVESCVYGWRRGERYLYIGRTLNLFRRIGGHHVIDSKESCVSGDVIDVWFCPEHKLDLREKLLIKEHRPLFNINTKTKHSTPHPQDIYKKPPPRKPVRELSDEELQKIQAKHPELDIEKLMKNFKI